MSDLPRGWGRIRLGDHVYLAGRIGWRGLKADEYTESGPLLLSTYNLNYGNEVDYRDANHISRARYDESPEIMVCEDDILLTKDGAGIGKLGIVKGQPQEATINSSLLLIRARGSIVPKYLFFFFAGPKLQRLARERITGSTTPHLFQRDIKEFDVAVPPVNEQRRIVAKVEALQARSRRAREALDAVPPLLEKVRQSILAAAFRGDLTADWRAKHKDVEPASELLKRIRTERRKKWEESELAKMKAKGKRSPDEKWKAKYKEPEPLDTTGLPELPQGWCWATFETVAEVALGRQRAPQYQTGRFTRPYLRVANVKDDRIDFSDVLEMDFDEEDFAHYQLARGDVLLSEGQSPELVGQSAIYEGGIDGLCFQKTLHRFRPYPSGPSSQYAQLLFRYYLRSGVFRSVASLTVNIAHLTLVRLKPLHFPVPPKEEERELVRRACLALERVSRLETALAGLRRRHRALDRAALGKAFRGELVPQDPNDEPAETMLARARATTRVEGSNGHVHKAAKKLRISTHRSREA